jgi:cytidylate kinase
MARLIIAIDGPVGSGKSTVARRTAELLGYTYLDSGAMYRALALKAIRAGVALDDAAGLERIACEAKIELVAAEQAGPNRAEVGSLKLEGQDSNLQPRTSNSGVRVLLDGEDVTAAIRAPEVSQGASRVAVFPGVRTVLVEAQRRAGAAGGVVMEGRDIGTVVFPDAGLKVFLTASVDVRAARRLRDHAERGESLTLEQMVEEVRARDARDRARDASPLARAPDAVLIDNTAMDVEETARLVVLLARERAGQ